MWWLEYSIYRADELVYHGMNNVYTHKVKVGDSGEYTCSLTRYRGGPSSLHSEPVQLTVIDGEIN